MAYTGTVCTETEIAIFAGELVDSTGNTEANRNLLVAQAESFLSNLMRFNVVDNFAALNADVKRMLSEWAARYCGISLIAFNMHGFGSTESTARIHAEDLVNIHAWRMHHIELILKDQNSNTFIKGA